MNFATSHRPPLASAFLRLSLHAVFALAFLSAHAATITGSLLDIYGAGIDRTLKISPRSTPQSVTYNGTNYIVMDLAKTVSSTNSIFAVVLLGGIYNVDFGTVNGVATPVTKILVPPYDTNTYSFNFVANLATNLGTFVWTNSYGIAAGTNITFTTNGALVKINASIPAAATVTNFNSITVTNFSDIQGTLFNSTGTLNINQHDGDGFGISVRSGNGDNGGTYSPGGAVSIATGTSYGAQNIAADLSIQAGNGSLNSNDPQVGGRGSDVNIAAGTGSGGYRDGKINLNGTVTVLGSISGNGSGLTNLAAAGVIGLGTASYSNSTAFAPATVTNLTAGQLAKIAAALTNSTAFAPSTVTNLTAGQLATIAAAVTNNASPTFTGLAVGAQTALDVNGNGKFGGVGLTNGVLTGNGSGLTNLVSGQIYSAYLITNFIHTNLSAKFWKTNVLGLTLTNNGIYDVEATIGIQGAASTTRAYVLMYVNNSISAGNVFTEISLVGLSYGAGFGSIEQKSAVNYFPLNTSSSGTTDPFSDNTYPISEGRNYAGTSQNLIAFQKLTIQVTNAPVSIWIVGSTYGLGTNTMNAGSRIKAVLNP